MITALLLSTLAATPKELGLVAWRRDFEAARSEAQKTQRPLLVLFDEVPGCATCVRYGEVVLSHPLLVEAAETLFVPVAIYNNEGGADREVLERFKEPAWNNPVVRIVDGEERDLAQRLNGDYQPSGLAHAMVTALAAAKAPVPAWLSALEEELLADQRASKQVTLAMSCFWTGEACLGALDGVLETRTGFADGQEVVEVRYDPTRISAEAIRGAGCGAVAAKVALSPSPKDDKYHLRRSPWARASLTPAQASRVNAAIARGEDPSRYLSPRQLARSGASVGGK